MSEHIELLENVFGAKINIMYNIFAFKEILANPEKYPHIYAILKQEFQDECDSFDACNSSDIALWISKNKNFNFENSDYFEDISSHFGEYDACWIDYSKFNLEEIYTNMLELYKAFLKVVIDNEEHSHDIRKISFGLAYNNIDFKSFAQNGTRSYEKITFHLSSNDINSIEVYNLYTLRDMIDPYPLIENRENTVCINIFRKNVIGYKILESILNVNLNGLNTSFDNEDFIEYPTFRYGGGYAHYYYDIDFGGNIFVFNTDMDDPALSLIKDIILSNLPERCKELNTVKRIYNYLEK